MRRSDNVAGIDGCKAGWIVATVDDVFVVPRLNCDRFDIVGVDIPIGLTDRSPRVCDREARRYLATCAELGVPCTAPRRSDLHRLSVGAQGRAKCNGPRHLHADLQHHGEGGRG